MKKQLIIIAVVLVSAVSFGQKKELKKAEKAIASGDFTEALSLLNTAEGMLGAASDDQKSLFHLLNGQALAGSAKGDFSKIELATQSIGKAIEMGGKNSSKAMTAAQDLRVKLINEAVSDQNLNRHDMASKKLYATYMMTKTDTTDLYYAAGAAFNAKDFDKAIDYYKTLIDLGFTDKKTQLVATNKASGDVQTFGSKLERNIAIKTGEFIKPETKKTESKRPEIFRNLVLILTDQDKTDEAVSLVQKARKESPNDIELIKVEASIAFNAGDMERYDALMKEVIKTDPTNPLLYFNLGIAASNNDQYEAAENYYKKAIELDPKYTDALINLGVLKLSKEKEIIDEMNNLGTSRADNARYDVLKEERKEMYKNAIPFLEQALETSDTPNEKLMKSLLDIYSQIGEDAKFKAMKAKVDALKN